MTEPTGAEPDDDDVYEYLQDVFDEALGVYVGPASYDEVIEALTDVPPTSELIVRVETPKGVDWRQGSPEHFVVDGEGRPQDLFLIGGGEGMRTGRMWRDPSFAYDLQDFEKLNHDELKLDAERFSGGVRLRMYAGCTITAVVWHPVLHETETGDVAPGMGPFTAELRVDEDEEPEG